jgi:hypothetical protein
LVAFSVKTPGLNAKAPRSVRRRRVYAQKQAAGDHAAAEIVKDVSPNAWQHIHLIGAFDFEQTESQIDIHALAARYDDPDFWNRALVEAPDDSLT